MSSPFPAVRWPSRATRPVNTPAALRVLEDTLAVCQAQGVPLGLAMDAINAVMTFTIGHTLAEVGTTPGAAADPPEPPADADAFPLFAEALEAGAGFDFDNRFSRTVDMIIAGHAALAAP